jgi:hypothetical protein
MKPLWFDSTSKSNDLGSVGRSAKMEVAITPFEKGVYFGYTPF